MIITLLLLFLATRLTLVRRSVERLRLAGRMRGVQGDAPDRVGISLLLTEGTDTEQLIELLSVEYARYEVIVLLDRLREGELFAELVARYHLIRVEYLPSGELPVEEVVGLYRSRKRRFRRLVLLDAVAVTPALRRNAAADVAVGEYLLPVRSDERLVEGIIERLAALLGNSLAPPSLLRTTVGARAVLCSREAVVAHGGFAHYPHAWQGTLLHAPILLPAAQREAFVLRPFVLLGLAVAVVVALLLHRAWWWALVATLIPLLCLLTAVRIAQLIRPEA